MNNSIADIIIITIIIVMLLLLLLFPMVLLLEIFWGVPSANHKNILTFVLLSTLFLGYALKRK